ncbi:MAG: trypsin-like peptidase domain-containing protein [Patescibacteria group bacterium]
MLAKIFSFLLGIIGVVTTALSFPVPQTAIAPKITPTKTETVVENTKSKTNDFSQLKSASTTTQRTATTTAKEKTPAKKPTENSKTPVPNVVASKIPYIPKVAVATTTTPAPPTDFNALNQKARAAVVNILCTSAMGGIFEPISGSGVLIDSRGIILTNAHIAQFLLLEDSAGRKLLNCIVRTGSPAVATYRVNVVYISPQWVKDNYKNLRSQNPTGTGENDFALLQVTGYTNPDLVFKGSVPSMSVEYNDNAIKTGNLAVLAAYPAGFLGGIEIQRDLYITSTIINLGQLFTFKTGEVDLFSLGGSPVAQHGSSGGAAVDTDGKLIGIIVTSTDATNTSDRDLNAISTSYINRNLKSTSGISLEELLNSSLSSFSAQFDTASLPEIKKLLFEALTSGN